MCVPICLGDEAYDSVLKLLPRSRRHMKKRLLFTRSISYGLDSVEGPKVHLIDCHRKAGVSAVHFYLSVIPPQAIVDLRLDDNYLSEQLKLSPENSGLCEFDLTDRFPLFLSHIPGGH